MKLLTRVVGPALSRTTVFSSPVFITTHSGRLGFHLIERRFLRNDTKLVVKQVQPRDEEELVPLCVGDYGSLKGAFTLQGGASMRVKHIRSYSAAELKRHVMDHNGPDGLVPAWLDENNLRPLLRDYLDPTEVKRPKGASIPSGVFGEEQSKSVSLLVVLFIFLTAHHSSGGLCSIHQGVSNGSNPMAWS